MDIDILESVDKAEVGTKKKKEVKKVEPSSGKWKYINDIALHARANIKPQDKCKEGRTDNRYNCHSFIIMNIFSL